MKGRRCGSERERGKGREISECKTPLCRESVKCFEMSLPSQLCPGERSGGGRKVRKCMCMESHVYTAQ